MQNQMFHKRLVDHESAAGSAPPPGGLYTHMEKIGLNADMPIQTWFRRGFAGVLNVASLQRIWDKVVGGSLLILVYVAVALVETSKMALLQCQTTKEGIRCLVSVCRVTPACVLFLILLTLTQTSQETDDLVAQKALEMWVQDGSHLNAGEKSHSRPTSSSLVAAAHTNQKCLQTATTAVRSGSFQLSSEIKIPDDLDLNFEGVQDNKDQS